MTLLNCEGHKSSCFPCLDHTIQTEKEHYRRDFSNPRIWTESAVWCSSFGVTHVSGCEGTHLPHSQGLLLQITTSICTLTPSGAWSQSRRIPVCPSSSERRSVSKPSPLRLTLNPPWTRWWNVRNGLEKYSRILFFPSLCALLLSRPSSSTPCLFLEKMCQRSRILLTLIGRLYRKLSNRSGGGRGTKESGRKTSNLMGMQSCANPLVSPEKVKKCDFCVALCLITSLTGYCNPNII